MTEVAESNEMDDKKSNAKGVIVRLLREHLFGISTWSATQAATGSLGLSGALRVLARPRRGRSPSKSGSGAVVKTAAEAPEIR